MLENENINEPQTPALLVGAVIRSGNPWFNIKCEECKQQILSYRNLGLASYFHKDDEDPWRTGMATSPIIYICGRCSDKLGYDDGR
jgi:hypothetical protein